MSTTTAIYLDKRRANKNGKFPVKIRVTNDRTSRLYKTGYFLTESEYKKVSSHNTRSASIRRLSDELLQYELKAKEIINEMQQFSFESFADKYLNRESSTGLNFSQYVLEAFDLKVKELEEEDRIGTANLYHSAKVSLAEFNNNKDFHFSKVTVHFLKKFEEWHKKNGKTNTTIGIYLRNLRALYNEAILNKIVTAESYPFGVKKGMYKIPTSTNSKKALSKAELKKIFNYTPESWQEEKYRDLWVFSYYCNGLNTKDICLLKYSNIKGDIIEFKREKTKRSNVNQAPIKAAYIEPLKDVVKKWGVPNKPDNFIFPVLDPNDKELQIKNKVDLLVSKINKYMRRIAHKLEIETKITTYTARHSFASVLRNSGVNISFISQSLGHKNISTTQSYLDSLEEEDVIKNANYLNPNN